MAICEACGQDKVDPNTITCEPAVLRFRGDSKRYPIQPYMGPGTCPDCGVATGGYHHVECDQMRCPKCNKPINQCPDILEEIYEPKSPLWS